MEAFTHPPLSQALPTFETIPLVSTTEIEEALKRKMTSHLSSGNRVRI